MFQLPYQRYSFASYWVLAAPERTEATADERSISICPGGHQRQTGLGLQQLGADPRSEHGNEGPDREGDPLFWILGLFTVRGEKTWRLLCFAAATLSPMAPLSFSPQNHHSESVTFTYSRERRSQET